MAKRHAEDFTSSSALIPLSAKKARNDLVIPSNDKRKALIEAGPPRTSSLAAPVMQLSGHQGEIFTCKFHPDGKILASAGFDRQIFLWNVFGECENLASLLAHKGAILELQYSSDGNQLYTASTDKTVAIWDSETYSRIKILKGHNNIVNSCHPSRRGPQLLCSGGDDCNLKVWDLRARKVAHSYKDKYQILAVTFNENSDQVIFGGLENVVKVYDMRKNDIFYSMLGHFDSITGLTLSPDGSFVLSNAMDNTLCIWDIRPFAPQERCVQTFQGHQHNFEKNLLRCSWSSDGTKVSAGSADRFVYIWDTHYRRILFKLPGHRGSVNEVVFHPHEPIVLSCSSDSQLFLGEIEH